MNSLTFYILCVIRAWTDDSVSELIKCGLIVFLLICRKDHEVPDDAHDSRAGGGVPYCASRRCFTVGENYKGNTQNAHTRNTKTDSVSEQTELSNTLFLFWQCCKWVLPKMTNGHLYLTKWEKSWRYFCSLFCVRDCDHPSTSSLILYQGYLTFVKEMVWHFGKCIYSLSFWELD